MKFTRSISFKNELQHWLFRTRTVKVLIKCIIKNTHKTSNQQKLIQINELFNKKQKLQKKIFFDQNF